MKKPDRYVKINITVRPEVLRQIDDAAWKAHMSRSEFLRYAAIKYIDAHRGVSEGVVVPSTERANVTKFDRIAKKLRTLELRRRRQHTELVEFQHKIRNGEV